MNHATSRARLLALCLVALLLGACGGGGEASNAQPPVKPTIVDTDLDGTPDNLDAAPKDAICAAASDAINGECILRLLAGSRLKVVGNTDGKLFFSAEGDALMLYAYDLKTQHFLGRAALQGYTPKTFAYVPAHGRLYVGDTNGGIHAYTESLTENSALFAKLPLSVNGLAAAGKYLMAQDGTGAWETHYFYDAQGTLAESKDWNYYSRHYEWSPTDSRLYFFRDDTSPNDLMFEVIDQSTGRRTATGETPYHGSYAIQGPIRVNRSGDKVLLGSGDIYAAPALSWAGKITTTIADALWLANGELLVSSPDPKGTRLKRFTSDRLMIEELVVEGELLAMAQPDTSITLVLKKTGAVEMWRYQPSDDTDGDGVNNLQDKFPLDKAAALDSDNDGYPDAWVPGRSAADSSTGLTLDAYPKDPSCHLPEQGDGTRCKPELSAPPAQIDQFFSDEQGIAYLYSKASGRVYRWSAASEAYLPPLAVGQGPVGAVTAPTLLAHSAEHRRLYLGYASGQITSIDLNGELTERPFASTSLAVQGLAAVGSHVLAQDASGAWESHYVFDKSGKQTDNREWNHYSRHYAWAPTQSRVYFFRDTTSPNDLLYEEIDQATGKIKSTGETPYHGDYLITGPIRVSQGGGRIVLGSGDVYSTLDLTVVASLRVSMVDMQWLDDGSLASISDESGQTRLDVFSTALVKKQTRLIPGVPLSLFKLGSKLVLVTRLDGRLQVQPITP